GGDQVVDDESRPSNRAPRVVYITGAMQEIQHWILVAAGLVAGRRVHVHAADAAECCRVIVDSSDGTMRDILRVEQVRTGHDGETVDRRIRLTGYWVAGID